MDLVTAFQRLNVDADIKPYLYGVSYGSFLGQRYLQWAPAGQSGGVILDGLVSPAGTDMSLLPLSLFALN